MYLIVAFASLLAIVLGILVALYFQVLISRPVIDEPVPPEYAAQSRPISLNTVSAHLLPPKNIRFVVVRSPIEKPLSAQDVLGYFDAETANGLARFPDDFDILGGKDATLFDRAPLYELPAGSDISAPRAGLKPTPALIEQINNALPALKTAEQHVFSLKVVARDVYGYRSAPADVTFTLVYSPPVPAPTTPVAAMTELQRLARDIALVVDENRTPVYFEAYKRAMQIPTHCGTNEDDAVFVSSFRRAFEHLRARLRSANIEAFYAGVCDAWRQAIANETAAASRANAARNEAIARNMASHATAEMEKAGAMLARNSTISVVAGAISMFLIISLFLAFLAIENHSKAMRQAIEAIAGERRS